jgi:hypothetical protein
LSCHCQVHVITEKDGKEEMPDESAPAKPSAVEVFKTDSDYLKGDIPEELKDGEAGF